MRNLMFPFSYQKTYIVGKKENIYRVQKARVILHIYRTFWDKEKYFTFSFYSSILKHYIKEWKTS